MSEYNVQQDVAWILEMLGDYKLDTSYMEGMAVESNEELPYD